VREFPSASRVLPVASWFWPCCLYRGIGFALATKLLSIGFEVVLACRNAGRGKAAKDAILKIVGSEHPDRLHLLLVDVASVQSVASFCDTFQTQ
jgi:NAD(P)-dependent dehydrogenase (short-subunit alcohol dehydrogenase family)